MLLTFLNMAVFSCTPNSVSGDSLTGPEEVACCGDDSPIPPPPPPSGGG